MTVNEQNKIIGYRIGEAVLDGNLHALIQAGRQEDLPDKVFQVLWLLAEQAGVTVSRKYLIDQVWAGNELVGQRAVTNVMWQLRKLLTADACDEAIVTVAKTGYRLVLPTEALRERPASTTPMPASTLQSPPPTTPASSPATSPEASPHRIASARHWRLTARSLFLAAGLLALFVLLLWLLRSPPLAPPAASGYRTEKLTSLEGVEEFPRFSADGRWLAFSWEEQDAPTRLVIKDMANDQAPLRQLSFQNRNEVLPAWSPDGHSLAFVATDTTGRCQVWRKDLNTLDDTPISDCYYERYHRVMDWSPDGRWFAVARRDSAAGDVAIYLQDAATGLRRQLTEPEHGSEDSQLAFSHDGKQLAFVRKLTGTSRLFVTDLTGALRELPHDKAPIYGLAWRNDDSEIYVNSLRDGEFSIMAYAVDGEQVRVLHTTEAPFNMTPLPGAPDTLVFSKHKAVEHLELRTGADNKVLQVIDSTGRDMYGQWSNRHKRIIFVSTRSGKYEVWSIGENGEAAKQLTIQQGLVSIPAWSALDDRFALTIQDPISGRHALWLGREASGTLQKVIDEGFDLQNVYWDPEHARLYASSNPDGHWNIWQFDVDDGSRRQLTDQGGQYGQRHGDWLYFSKPAQPGLWRKPIAGGPETLLLSDLAVDDWGNWQITADGLWLVVRGAEQDEIQRRDPETGAIAERLRFPRNAIRIYRSLSVTDDGRLVLTILGRRQADLLLLKPVPEP